ncbi:MAG: OmpA family protein [Candidatus Kapabacteria bacterium]|nr:OmpA family protein [Candidatus Kapabacteria bacterium]
MNNSEFINTVINYKILVSLLLLLFTISWAQAIDSAYSKHRLPEIINSFQPTIIPVISPDGGKLYFDRKYHPDNSGSLKDADEIWYSSYNGQSWTMPLPIGKPLNNPESDVLFNFYPDAKSALFYNSYLADSANQNSYAIYQKLGSKWVFTNKINLKNYTNKSDHFFGNISRDARTLIFAAENENSFGKLDLFMSDKLYNNNSWSEAINLGITINSIENEGSPFLAWDRKTLYFTSEGHNGLGGFDIFMSKALNDSLSKWSAPVNLGSAFNTKFDENSLSISALGDTIYFVSYDDAVKREGIYFAVLPEKFRPSPYIILNVKFITKSNKTIKSTQLSIKNSDGSLFLTDEVDDEYTCVLDSGKEYVININSNGFEAQSLKYSTGALNKSERRNLIFELKEKEVLQALLLNIYFDYNKYEPDEKSSNLLKTMVTANKNIAKIIGFADLSGSAKYNLKLSELRANYIAEYLRNYGFKIAAIEFRGSSNAKAENNTDDRRVEIYWEK